MTTAVQPAATPALRSTEQATVGALGRAYGAAANDPQLAIVGGGITGLTAAWEAVKRGEKNIHVYEASQRLGGKIESGHIDGKMVNRGAEFIGSDETNLVGLCHDLGVPLIENRERKAEFFARPNGSIMDSETFHAAYRPYAEQVMRDRALMEAQPMSARAQHVRSLSLTDYLTELRDTTPPASRSWWQAIKDTLMLRGNESSTTLRIAANTYASEGGQPPSNISAAQFIAETSPEPNCFLACDERYLVAGGTEQLIVKLREALAAKGVTFHTGHELASVSKNDASGVKLSFANGAQAAPQKVILATPTYALAKVQGLTELGLSPQSQSLLTRNQYTQCVKVTVAFKPGMARPNEAFYAKGYQTWSPAPGMLTFLANADQLGTTQTPKELLSGIMESYAKAHGSTADAMFDVSKLSFNNPGVKGCYATPKAEHLAAIDQFRAELPKLAANGVGIAGSYMPHDGSYGFMECGVVSAKQSVAMLVGQEKSTAQEIAVTPQKQWVPHIEAQRMAAANDAQLNIAANTR